MKKQFLFFGLLGLFCAAFSQENDYGHWIMADSMNYPKGRGASTVLHSGKVLVVGRKLDCEIYDYTIDKWTLTDSLSIERNGHELVTLHDGRVLLAGNKDVNINEIFDETTGLWTLCDSFRLGPRYGGTLTILTNGKVLYTGGNVAGRISSSCELYDPESNTWTVVDSMNTSRLGHCSVLLSDGRVLATGGRNSLSGFLSSCEVYDPTINVWDDFPSMNTSHYEHEALVLEDDRIVVLSGSPRPEPSLCEYYDWETQSWFLTGRSILPVEKNYAVNLGNGYILIAAGIQWELLSYSLLYSQNIIFFRNTHISRIGLELLPDGSVLSIDEFGHFGDAIRTTGACERYFPATTKIKKLERYSINSFKLIQNYPNPFNAGSKIKYSLPAAASVEATIYDMRGREILSLFNGRQESGLHTFSWDGRNQMGYDVASGIYFCRVKCGEQIKTIKMALMR